MRAVVASRMQAAPNCCDACGRLRRCALIWIDNLGPDVRRSLRLCPGCCKAAWDAAKSSRKRGAA